MIRKSLSLLVLLLITSSCNSLYNQKIDEAKSALHEENYEKAIELIEAALIEKPNDKDAEALLEMAKSKHSKNLLNEKIKGDLSKISYYFNDFLVFYTSDYSTRIFTEEKNDENFDFFKEGIERQSNLEDILSQLVALEVDSSLDKMKEDIVRAVELEIEATKAGHVIFLLKGINHSDPKADPLNQFGNAMDTWTNNKEELDKLVPVIKNSLELQLRYQ